MIVTLSKAAKPPPRTAPVSSRTAKPCSKIWVPPREDEVDQYPANHNVASSRQMNVDQSDAANESHDTNSKNPNDLSEERSNSESEIHQSDEKSKSHQSVNSQSNSKEPECGSSNPRPGLPSVRPNAMKNRQKQLEALLKYEKRFRHADIVGPADAEADSPRLSQNLHNIRQQKSHNSNNLASLMALHILDISKILEHGTASWQKLNFEIMDGAPVETIFYTLIEGRGEILMFGGIEKDIHALQRGQGIQSHTMNNALFVLSPVQHLL